MVKKSTEQFDVLSNTLRVLPEEFLRLNYFIKDINEPEEGISNVEIACINVFNNIYGMMCCLKNEGSAKSMYEHDSITAILCIRHVLQHQSGRIKNNLRDAFTGADGNNPTLIKFNLSDKNKTESPFYIGISWFQEGISASKNARKLPAINKFWNLDKIKLQIESSLYGDWANTYICVMSLITEAVRTICVNYGTEFEPSGFDSDVYFEHFAHIDPLNPDDYRIAN